MEKYKICPCCQRKNLPALFECASCETDLTGVKITDEQNEKLLEQNTTPPQDIADQTFRVCDCGEKNAPNARKCSACGEDISDILPTKETEQEPTEELLFVLSSLDGKYAFKISAGEVTVGREREMGEYLASKIYVSRVHAKLTKQDGELFIENLSNTNFTFVNDQKITGKTKLQDGDELGLGGRTLNGQRQAQAAYFLVRIGTCM